MNIWNTASALGVSPWWIVKVLARMFLTVTAGLLPLLTTPNAKVKKGSVQFRVGCGEYSATLTIKGLAPLPSRSRRGSTKPTEEAGSTSTEITLSTIVPPQLVASSFPDGLGAGSLTSVEEIPLSSFT